MLKFIVPTVALLFSVNAFANSDYQGFWCNRYDDFTEVLIINQNDQVEMYSIGNEALEKGRSSLGYVSRGANSFQMNIEKQDMGVVDYEVGHITFSKRKTLTLFKKNGEKEKYIECSEK